MQVVYLCGGINGLSDAGCRDWRERAKDLLHAHTLDPMRRDYRGKEDDSVSEIVHGDIEDISHSHFILVNANTPSWGTAMEVRIAYDQGRRIVAFTHGSRVSPWLRYHCGHIVDTLESACAIINAEVG